MAKAIKKIGLGKGLEALLPSVEYTKEKGITFKQDSEELSDNGIFGYIEISKIQLNPYQPRRDFEPQALEELKNSIIFYLPQHFHYPFITICRKVYGVMIFIFGLAVPDLCPYYRCKYIFIISTKMKPIGFGNRCIIVKHGFSYRVFLFWFGRSFIDDSRLVA